MKFYQRRRAGTAMLETIVYVSLSGVLIVLTAQWFHVIFQVASQNKLRQRQHISLKRLVSDFRADVVSATELSVESPRQLSLVNTAGEEIVYRISKERVDRTVGDSRQPTRQEAYRDLDRLKIEWINEESGALPGWVAMNVYRTEQQKKPQLSAEKQNLQTPSAKPTGFKKPILQVRCGPRTGGLEVVQ